jgi:hypothetical protein
MKVAINACKLKQIIIHKFLKNTNQQATNELKSIDVKDSRFS